jgi:hypothetical protein
VEADTVAELQGRRGRRRGGSVGASEACVGRRKPAGELCCAVHGGVTGLREWCGTGWWRLKGTREESAGAHKCFWRKDSVFSHRISPSYYVG